MTTFFRNSTRAIRLGVFALSAIATVATAAPAQASGNFDGKWSVLIVTETGDCDRGYRYPVQISKGNVGYAGEASFTVSGKVNDTGAIVVKVSRGEQSAQGTGKLSGNAGTGSWKAGACAGSWTAERRS